MAFETADCRDLPSALFSGIAKLLNFSDAVAEFQHLSLPAPTLAVVATIVVQLAAPLLIILAPADWRCPVSRRLSFSRGLPP